MRTGLQIITEERERQIAIEGWTPEHDDKHLTEELPRAAAAYCVAAHQRQVDEVPNGPPWWWPFNATWWKPTPEDRIRELAKAGALIAAEIDRLNRKQSQRTYLEQNGPKV